MFRLLPLALLAFTSAASAASFSLAAGQTAQVGTAKITLLNFTDSRCPPRAYCIMAGNVTATVMVTRGSTTRTLKLFLPGRALNTPVGALKLTAATRLGEAKTQRLTFELVQP